MKDNKIRDGAIKLDETYFGDLDNAYKKLQEWTKKHPGELGYADFNVHTLYTDMSLDDVYVEVCNMPRDDYIKAEEKIMNELRKERAEREKSAYEQAPKWKEEGHKLFSEDKWTDWDKCVDTRVKDLYHGEDVKDILKVANILALSDNLEEVFAEAYDTLNNQGHSGASWGIVTSALYHFCPNGDAFREYVNAREQGIDTPDVKTKGHNAPEINDELDGR